MILILPSQATVLHAYAVLVGMTPGNVALKDHQAYIASAGTAGYKSALEGIFAGTSTASLATTMLTNLGLSTIFTQAQAESYLTSNPGNRVGAMIDLAGLLYGYAGTDAAALAAKTAYVSAIETSYAFSVNTANANGQAWVGTAGQTLYLTPGFDNLVGTAKNDSFLARTINNGDTFQDGDMVDGGTGTDTVYLDFIALANTITPNLKNIETVVVRAQSAGTDVNGKTSDSDKEGNNMPGDRTVQIDAQRSLATDAANNVTASTGVTRWESSNSRSDVVIEDVRIGTSQKTKDITIAFRESDPGNVDFGVYFDQHSLRNSSSSSSSLNLQLLDTRSQAAGTGPLKDNPYDSFAFYLGGATVIIKSAAIDTATTYAELLTAIQNAIVAARATTPALANVNATLGAEFTVFDTSSGTQVKGTNITLTDTSGAQVTLHPTIGWATATGTVPASSGLHTDIVAGTPSTVSELVTSTVVLDDVGRGSTGGDLVIGGLSVGDTSTSRGVERFEITVEDSSKLNTINSTNNALREVTIVNSANTTNNSSAYNTVVPGAGNLTVKGDTGQDDADLPGVNLNSTWSGSVGTATTVVHSGIGAKGFTDVRLIDGSAMSGKLDFTAAISTDSLGKYVNFVDTAASPTADVAGTGNVNFNTKGANFAYSGGSNGDTMNVTIDSAVAASTTLTGQSDFTIVIDGNAGNDVITTNIGGDETAAWVIDQARNANVTVNGGDGDDTITTTGAGKVIISAGAGADTVFADNSGDIMTNKWLVNATNTNLTDLSTAAPTSTFLSNGRLTVSFSGAGGAGLGGGVTAGVADSAAGNYTNGYEVVVAIPTGANYEVTQYHLNQAIKAAINDNAVLKKLLKAQDGPSGTLTIASLIDGAFNATDLSMTVTNPTLSAAEETTALAALKTFAHDSSLTTGAAQAANTLSVGTLNAIIGMSTGAAGAGSVLSTGVTGAISGAESDNVINMGSGADVLVLGTGASSNDVIKFSGTDIGTNAIVNFQDGAVGANTNRDILDFTSYLTSKKSSNVTSVSTDSQVRIATTLDTDGLLEANSVRVISGVTFSATETFAGLTGATLLAAINKSNVAGAGDWGTAGLAEATLNAVTTYTSTAGANYLVGSEGKAIVMVENTANEGEYKVFELTFNGVAATNANADFSAAVLIGTVDFGNSLTLDGTATTGNLA